MRALSATITLGLLLTVGVGSAVADSECVQNAKEQRGLCRMDCDEDFVIVRTLCRNIDPECAAGCRVALGACRRPPRDFRLRDDIHSGTLSALWTVVDFDMPLFVPSSWPWVTGIVDA